MNDEPEPREGGAWIGQHPDENTEHVREQLDQGAERVAVTQNEPGGSTEADAWPGGHRDGDQAGENG